MTKLLTYVASESYNMLTGERFPDAQPVLRTVGEIYTLLQRGLTVHFREGYYSKTLEINAFYDAYKKEIDSLTTPKTVVEQPKKQIKNNYNIKK